jgi:thiol:disulfide interchange protein/DsbC/DsbD-like thiol-disulfide interchange protein
MAQAAPPMRELVQAELIAEPAAIAPGQPFWVGIRLRIKQGWHVYWRNPGDSGEGVTVAWQLPPGFAADPIAWPTPSRIPVAHLVNFGYEHETTLLARIVPPATLAAGTPVGLEADVAWLVCEKECIPGEARLSLTLPVAAPGASTSLDPRTRALFDAARAALPQAAPWPARLDVGPDWVTLSVSAPTLGGIRSATFFPYAETLIQHAAPQQLQVTSSSLALRMQRSALSTGLPPDAGGVLVLDTAPGPAAVPQQAFALANIAVSPAAVHATASLAAILQAAVLALLGGIILNLMPCVFPVLSIKVLSLVGLSGGNREEVRRHGLAYTAGVLAAFAALGAVLLGLRAAGSEVGWGFQLQSPLTVAVLAYVLFAMGLSLSGVFYLGGSVQGIGARLTRHPGLAGSFSTGVLAAVVATPCTAPFMATAVGFALTQPAAVALTIILALGLGLALPFLALTLAPHLIGRLPRPGAWMETLKQLLAFPVYATVAWLVWVLTQQVGPAGVLAALIGFVLIGLAAWSFNIAQTATPWARRLALGTVAASLVGAAAAIAGLDRAGPAIAPQAQAVAGYEPFTPQRLAELLAADRPVFVNMTAAWCITCLVNEHTALSTAAVRAAFTARNVAYLKGDWTSRNPDITRVLERHGRSGVPLYLLYAGAAEPVVLPQVLTPAIVLGEIDRIPGAPQRRASLPPPNKE